MSIIVFAGPTLCATHIQNTINADVRPPAKQGDIYLATLDKPSVIVLIDGYFDSVPAVWHKEILYALSLGINVYGCSSMGALRAAELADFGMIGFGAVFEDYANGILEDDDEVALIHGPAELQYPHLSVPMVNIRATLARAVETQLINPEESAAIVAALKRLHYPKRTFSQLHACASRYLGDIRAQTWRKFIDDHYFDIKQHDAIALLKHLCVQPNLLQPIAPDMRHHFKPTDSWERLVSQLDQQRKLSRHAVTSEELHRELKIDGCYWELRQQAIARKSALRTAATHNPTLSDKHTQSALLEIALRQSAYQGRALDFDRLANWLTAQQINNDDFETLVAQQSLLAWLDEHQQSCDEELIDLLKLAQRYGDYQTRITAKRGIALRALSDLNIDEQQLWKWFFTTKYPNHPTNTPNDVWPTLGFSSFDELKQAVIQDYQFHLTIGKIS